MVRQIARYITGNRGSGPPIPHGVKGVLRVGHREYVGGKWEEIGNLQFAFMLNRGLRPQHCFLDVGCGSLRGGVHFIKYLARGHYLGIEKERLLVEAGIVNELGKEAYEDKAPEFVISSNFEFGRFTRIPSFALAQSLFTHLVPNEIEMCMERLRQFVTPGCRFYVTFFESDRPQKNPGVSHDHLAFYYTKAQMMAFGTKCNWRPWYVGEWGHPRGQVMMEYLAI